LAKNNPHYEHGIPRGDRDRRGKIFQFFSFFLSIKNIGFAKEQLISTIYFNWISNLIIGPK
jgi:hypothetical protein